MRRSPSTRSRLKWDLWTAKADGLADSVDCYPAMDFVEMTADGKWVPDTEAIASVAAEYAG